MQSNKNDDLNPKVLAFGKKILTSIKKCETTLNKIVTLSTKLKNEIYHKDTLAIIIDEHMVVFDKETSKLNELYVEVKQLDSSFKTTKQTKLITNWDINLNSVLAGAIEYRKKVDEFAEISTLDKNYRKASKDFKVISKGFSQDADSLKLEILKLQKTLLTDILYLINNLKKSIVSDEYIKLLVAYEEKLGSSIAKNQLNIDKLTRTLTVNKSPLLVKKIIRIPVERLRIVSASKRLAEEKIDNEKIIPVSKVTKEKEEVKLVAKEVKINEEKPVEEKIEKEEVKPAAKEVKINEEKPIEEKIEKEEVKPAAKEVKINEEKPVEEKIEKEEIKPEAKEVKINEEKPVEEKIEKEEVKPVAKEVKINEEKPVEEKTKKEEIKITEEVVVNKEEMVADTLKIINSIQNLNNEFEKLNGLYSEFLYDESKEDLVLREIFDVRVNNISNILEILKSEKIYKNAPNAKSLNKITNKFNYLIYQSLEDMVEAKEQKLFSIWEKCINKALIKLSNVKKSIYQELLYALDSNNKKVNINEKEYDISMILELVKEMKLILQKNEESKNNQVAA